jgi:CMP-N-acetylneuraminic acid synthetase
MNILAIIPARGGSKGIPKKNIIDVLGKPLIAYTIEPALTALQQGFIQELIVSTDSDEIAEVAKSLGANVPFIRPADLAADQSKSIDLIQHAIQYYAAQNRTFDAVLLLQPTSPLRTTLDIQKAIELFKHQAADSLISGYKEEYINDLVLYHLASDGVTTIPLNKQHNQGVRRQDHGHVYVRNGCIYLSKVALIQNGLIIGDQPLMYVMDKKQSINIDNMDDLELIKAYL